MRKPYILRTATRFVSSLILLFSMFILIRGHNEPGGGFAAGLIASTGFALVSLAEGTRDTRLALRIRPRSLAAAGGLVVIGSGLLGPALGMPYLSGVWRDFGFGESHAVALGTPILFDIGVFLVVLGTAMSIILTLEERA